jgi:hypothetical protein
MKDARLKALSHEEKRREKNGSGEKGKEEG